MQAGGSSLLRVSNARWVSIWYQLTWYDAVRDVNYVPKSSSLDSVKVGHSIYCFDEM